MPWKQIIKSNTSGAAKYKPGISIQQLEMKAWRVGMSVKNGNWRVMPFDDIIGASGEKETQYMRVEMSANTIHGHPITQAEYLKYIGQ